MDRKPEEVMAINSPPLVKEGPWTDEIVKVLKRRWMEGASAGEIARELGGGVTRNAVIGKVHRLKLASRGKVVTRTYRKPPKPERPKRPEKIARLSMSFPKAPPVQPESFLTLPESDPKPLMETTGCMWPIGDHGLFCNAGRETGSHYCSHHHARAYRKAA